MELKLNGHLAVMVTALVFWSPLDRRLRCRLHPRDLP